MQAPEPLDTDIVDFDLGSATNVQSILADEDTGPDFSPETAGLRPMDALTSTFVGNETQVAFQSMILIFSQNWLTI